jgi:hypothetical protein
MMQLGLQEEREKQGERKSRGKARKGERYKLTVKLYPYPETTSICIIRDSKNKYEAVYLYLSQANVKLSSEVNYHVSNQVS